MIAAVTPAHQNAARPPAPYYPAPDTSWSKDTAAVEKLPPYDNDMPEVAQEPQPVVAEPAPVVEVAAATEAVTETATETLLTPPVALAPVETPPAPQPAEEPAKVADKIFDLTPVPTELAPMSPAQPGAPVETVADAAAPTVAAAAPAVDETPASPSLVATLNWVYGDKTA